jgi:hypothetical protein
MPCDEAPRRAPAQPPPRPVFRAEACRVQAQSRDHGEDVSILGVNRDPTALATAAVAGEFLRYHRFADEPGVMQKLLPHHSP